MAADDRISACVDNDRSVCRTVNSHRRISSVFHSLQPPCSGYFKSLFTPPKFPVARLRELPIQVIDLPTAALLCDDGFLGDADISLYFTADCKAGAAFARRQVGTPTVACVTIASPPPNRGGFP